MSDYFGKYLSKMLKGNTTFSSVIFLLFLTPISKIKSLLKDFKFYNISLTILQYINLFVNKYHIVTISFIIFLFIAIIIHFSLLSKWPFKKLKRSNPKYFVDIYSGTTYCKSIKAIVWNILTILCYIIVDVFRTWFILNNIINSTKLLKVLHNSCILYIVLLLNIVLALVSIKHKLCFRKDLQKHILNIQYFFNNKYFIIKEFPITNMHTNILLIKPNTLNLSKYNKIKCQNYFILKSIFDINNLNKISKLNKRVSKYKQQIYKYKNEIGNIYKQIDKCQFRKFSSQENHENIKNALINKNYSILDEYISYLGDLQSELKSNKLKIKDFINKCNYQIIYKDTSFDACITFLSKYKLK